MTTNRWMVNQKENLIHELHQTIVVGDKNINLYSCLPLDSEAGQKILKEALEAEHAAEESEDKDADRHL